jgi:hypothetical protein
MFKQAVITLFILGVLFSCSQNSKNEENQNIEADLPETGFISDQILPNKFDTSTLFISVDDYFSEEQVIQWANRKFMALIYDTVTMEYALIEPVPNNTTDLINKIENGNQLFENFSVFDEEGNAGYSLDIELALNTKCLYLIDNPYMKQARSKIKSFIDFGLTLEPGLRAGWYVGQNYVFLDATADLKINGPDTNFFNYQLRYTVRNEKNQEQNTMLSFIPWFDGGFVKIIFAGDLDGDNKPDWIIDNCHKYTNSDISGVLYSTNASKDGSPKAISAQDWGNLRHHVFHTEGC